MEVSRTILIVHGEDDDGILSGAVLLEYFGAAAELYVVSHNTLRNTLSHLSETGRFYGARVVVADLALKTSYFDSQQKSGHIAEIIEMAESVVWIDHHETPEVERFRALGGEFIGTATTGRCACSLCGDWLKLRSPDNGNGAARYLTRECLAQASDYPESAVNETILAQSERLQRVITYYNYRNHLYLLCELAQQLACGSEWNAIIDEHYATCEKHILAELEEFDKNQTVIEIGVYRFLVALVSPVLPQKEILRKLRLKYDATVSACIGIFPSPISNALVFGGGLEPRFPVQDFCRFLDGGGRENDGGFSLYGGCRWHDFLTAQQEITRLLKAFLVID